MSKFLKILICYTTDENGVRHFDTEPMHREFEIEIKKLDDQTHQSIDNFLNKVGTKLDTKKFNNNLNYRKKISNDLAKFGGNE